MNHPRIRNDDLSLYCSNAAVEVFAFGYQLSYSARKNHTCRRISLGKYNRTCYGLVNVSTNLDRAHLETSDLYHPNTACHSRPPDGR
jgi:hypothetical protein